MGRILAGIETEYGLAVEGRGPADQIHDSMALVRSFPDPSFEGWDYRNESPRADLRGFKVDSLKTDPEDARFDSGRSLPPAEEQRSDRILANGARFYNDHGHPEYATPECLGLDELVRQDAAGERAVLLAARSFEAATGHRVHVYKNNSDYSGASYGCHESYLVPRSVGFESLYRAVTPMLVARTLLCGSGKVGFEAGEPCKYQISQRADFFAQDAAVDTLYRRPIFNTRDEPHADANNWVRLHVIAGDANRMPHVTRWKVGLLKLAVALAVKGIAPTFDLKDAPAAMQNVSRSLGRDATIDLSGEGRTSAKSILDAYVSLSRETDDEEVQSVADEVSDAIAGEDLRDSTEWGMKLSMLDEFRQGEGLDWSDPHLRSLELQYHLLDPHESLFEPLCAQTGTATIPESEKQLALCAPSEGTRALARSVAVRCLRESLLSANWRTLTFRAAGGDETIDLDPARDYSAAEAMAQDVDAFVQWLKDDS